MSEADGLDLTPANLVGSYGDGMLVVQDGHKRLPHGPQNFKLVPWAAVEKAMKLECGVSPRVRNPPGGAARHGL